MSLKRLMACVLAGSVTLASLAVPAKRGLRTFTQPDGTVITVNLIGDEHFHTYATADGLAVARGADGCFYYVGADGLTGVVAHDAGARNAAEAAFVAGSGASLSVERLASSRRSAVNARRASAASPRKASQVPSSGSPRVPVILVQYSDYKFKDADPLATFKSFFTEGEKSAHQYFVDQSNGKYTPQFDVYGPYTLSGTRASYGGNDFNGDDKGVGKMVAQGCIGLDSKVDFSLYDNDGDRECDVVIVLYAGDGEASSYDDDCENAVWPCQWALSSSDYGRSLTLDGIKVDKFAVFNELNGTDLSKIDGIGTFCHEFSHCLDLPDFYDTAYSGPLFGMNCWSLLDYGCYNDDGYTPVGYTAYEKEFMGWINIEEATENTRYNLPVFNQKNVATDRAIKITNPADKDEYFIIENRANQGWDKYMPAEGLLIYHVTYNSSVRANNTVNNNSMQRMTPVPADNELKINKENYWGETYYVVDEESLKGDLWPWNGADEFTDNTKPAAKFNTGGRYVGKPVTEITRKSDGTVSFWVAKVPAPAVAAPVTAAHNVLSPTSVELNWTAGDANDVTYTVEIREHRDITYQLVGSTDFSRKDHGWTSAGYTVVEEAEGAVRMGSNNNIGRLTSKSFDTDAEGAVTVRFSAKYYGTDGSQLKVSIVDAAGTELDTETVNLSADYDDYALLLQGKPESATSVVFATVAKKKRVFIKAADIYTGDATEIETVARAAAYDNRTITGITATSHVVTGLKENAVYDYRVKAVPVDEEAFSSSAWTDMVSVDLSTSGIGSVVADGEAEAVYYNLQGMRVDRGSLVPGVYIVRQGAETRKVVVR